MTTQPTGPTTSTTPPIEAPALPRGGGLLPSRFPTKYAAPETSPLAATVERGQKNDFQFDVTK